MTTSHLRMSRLCAAGTVALVLTACGHTAPPPTATVAPPTAVPTTAAAPVGTPVTEIVPPGQFSAVARLVDDAIAARQLPGGVVEIGHAGTVVFRKAFGSRTLAGEPGLTGAPAPAETMTVDTVFDVASLTKGLATATAVMQLFEQGRVRLDDALQTYLPEFNPDGDARRARVTLRMLLTHTSGIAGDLSLDGPWGLTAADKEQGIRRALAAWVVTPPGEGFHYCDINFIILGALLEKLTGEPEDRYVNDHVFAPLGMSDTRYLPATKACGPHRIRGTAVVFDPEATRPDRCPGGTWSTDLLPRIAPTALDEDTAGLNPDFGHPLRGTVHDPTARRMGGVAGSAGLFTTAADVGRYARALLDRRAGRPSAFPLSPSSVQLMTTPQQPGHDAGQVAAANEADTRSSRAVRYPALPGQNLRGLGWDIDTPHSRPRGAVFPVGSFGHTGFTGVSLWMDPESDTYVAILTNAIHQRGAPPIGALSGQVATEAARALHLYGT